MALVFRENWRDDNLPQILERLGSDNRGEPSGPAALGLGLRASAAAADQRDRQNVPDGMAEYCAEPSCACRLAAPLDPDSLTAEEAPG